MLKCDIKKFQIHDEEAVKKKSGSSCYKLVRKGVSSTHVTAIILGMLAGVTVFNIFASLLQHLSNRVATGTYRWYRTPQDCLKSTSYLGELVDLTSRATKAMDRLGIPAPVCYGTLWGVLRDNDILPWDNNVDFCVMNEYLHSVSFLRLQRAFAEQGVLLHDFSYSIGSYRMQRGSAEGHINVFTNCTHIAPVLYLDLNISSSPGEKSNHWACALSIASAISKLTYDLNRPFPTWLLTPPFAKRRFADTYVNVPHDNFEIQKYLYPDDWCLQIKPLGCL